MTASLAPLSSLPCTNHTICPIIPFLQQLPYYTNQSVSQSVAIYLVDVLKENKHKLGQHKGQVKKFNINVKKIFYINKETAKNRLRSTSQAATLGSYRSNFSW